MEIFLSAIYGILFCWIILKCNFFKVEGISPYIFVVIYILKLLSALLLTIIYTYYYTDRSTADIYKYFDDAKVIFSALPSKPYDYFRMVTGIDSQSSNLRHYYNDCNFWFKKFDYMLYNDNRTIIRFNAIIMLFSFGKLFVHSIFMSFLSMVGLMGIFKVFIKYFKAKKWDLLITIFLLPSVLLWTSGPLKEGIVVFALGLFFYKGWIILYEKFKFIDVIICILMIFILVLAKYYVIACTIPGIIYLLSKRFLKLKSDIILSGLPFLICFGGLIICRYVGGNFDVIKTLAYKQNDFVMFSLSLNNVGSLMDTYMLKPTILDFIKHTPMALFNSLFKPLPWDVHNIMSILPAFENIVLIVLLISIIIKPKIEKNSIQLLLFSISFILCLNVLNGLIVPVYGALVRYKVPALPFLFSVLVCINQDSIFKRINKRYQKIFS